MQIIEANGEGIGIVHEQATQSLLVWLVVTDSADWRESELGQRVLRVSATDVPSCIVIANASVNPWVNEEVSDYDGGTLVVPYCGGFGVSAIRNIQEFEANSAMAIDMARQAKAGWESAVGKS